MMSFEVVFQMERFCCQFGPTNISIAFNFTEKFTLDFLKIDENF